MPYRRQLARRKRAELGVLVQPHEAENPAFDSPSLTALNSVDCTFRLLTVVPPGRQKGH